MPPPSSRRPRRRAGADATVVGLVVRSAVLLLALLAAGALIWLAPPGLGAWRIDVEQRFPHPGHDGAIGAVAMDDGETLAVSGGLDGRIRLWHLDSGAPAAQPADRAAAVRAVALSGDGRHFAAGDDAGVVRAGSSATAVKATSAMTPDFVVELGGAVRAVALDRAGRWLATAADRLILFDLVDGSRRDLGPIESDRPLLAFSGGGQALIVTDARGLRTWSLGDGDGGGARRLALDGTPAALAVTARIDAAMLSGDQSERVALAIGTGVEVWDLASGDRLAARSLSGEAIATLAWQDDETIVATTAGGLRYRWQWRNDGVATAPAMPLRSASTSTSGRDGGAVLTGGHDGVLRYHREPPDGGRTRLIGAPILTFAVSDDGTLVASSEAADSGGTGTLVLRRRPGGEPIQRLDLDAAALCLAFDAEARALALHSAGGVERSIELDGSGRDRGRASGEVGPPTAADGPCPPPHARRFALVQLAQVHGDVLFLRDARTDLLLPLSDAYLKATDVPRRSLADRFRVRFGFVGLHRDGDLIFGTVRPQIPLPPLLLAVFVLVPGLSAVLRRLRRRQSDPRA